MLNRFEKFTFFIEEVSRVLHKIMGDEMEFFGLKGPSAFYILALSSHSEGITISAIAEKCGRDKADVSRAVTSLCAKGLVHRKSGTKNNYRALILLTEKGEDLAARLRKKAKNAVEYASHDVSDDDRRIFYDTLETIYTNLCTMSKIGVPDGTND